MLLKAQVPKFSRLTRSGNAIMAHANIYPDGNLAIATAPFIGRKIVLIQIRQSWEPMRKEKQNHSKTEHGMSALQETQSMPQFLQIMTLENKQSWSCTGELRPHLR